MHVPGEEQEGSLLLGRSLSQEVRHQLGEQFVVPGVEVTVAAGAGHMRVAPPAAVRAPVGSGCDRLEPDREVVGELSLETDHPVLARDVGSSGEDRLVLGDSQMVCPRDSHRAGGVLIGVDDEDVRKAHSASRLGPEGEGTWPVPRCDTGHVDQRTGQVSPRSRCP